MTNKTKTVSSPERMSGNAAPRWLLSLAFFSAASILYEILLSRIVSVVFSYHYSFAILSLAMAGIGFGGIFAQTRIGRNLGRAGGMALFTLASIFLMGLLVAYSLSGKFIPPLYAYALLVPAAVLPFAASGLSIAGFFRAASDESALIYFADLGGAALASAAAVPLLDASGPVKGIILVGALAIVGYVLAGEGRRRGTWFALAGLVVLTTVYGWVTYLPGVDVPIGNFVQKDATRAASDDRELDIVESRWSSFGRTDLVASDQWPDSMTLYVDGAAGTPMLEARKLLTSDHLLHSITVGFGGSFPMFFLDSPEDTSLLVIGPGGGRDVAAALVHGIGSITAVEVNPDILDIMAQYADYNGAIYSDPPNVSVIEEEGRRFVRSTKNTYDMILFTLPVTKSSRSIEGYALTEGYLYTVEAIRDYLSILNPGGEIVFVTHGPDELYRLASTVAAVFQDRGLSDSEIVERMYTTGPEMMPTLVVSNKPYSESVAAERSAEMKAMGFPPGSFYVPHSPVANLTPDLLATPFAAIENGTWDFTAFRETARFNADPAYDDSPFFYNLGRELPRPLPLLLISSVVLMVFLGAVIFRAARNDHKQGLPSGHTTLFSIAFGLLGTAFMIAEVASFQKLMLYLGNPAATLSVLLFSLLTGAGVGSFVASRFASRGKNHPSVPSAVAGVLLVGSIFLIRPLLAAGGGVAVKSGVLLILEGFFMGMPFPLLMQLASRMGLNHRVPLFWGVNGIMAVVGSVTAIALGVLLGFSAALALAGHLYLAFAALVIPLMKRASDLPSREPRIAAAHRTGGLG